jgi:non-heme chloroperoxidase
VPWSIANASYNRQKRNPGVTEIQKVPGRGHALTIDSGWRDVAQIALSFVQRFVSAEGATAMPVDAGQKSAIPVGTTEGADTRA